MQLLSSILMTFSIGLALLGGCGSPDIDELRQRAESKFREYLDEYYIDRGLFSGPETISMSESYVVFEWQSTIPTKGAVTISVPVFGRNGAAGDISLRTESRKNLWYLVWTRGRSTGEAMLANLFDFPFSRAEADSSVLDFLSRAPLSQEEMEEFANFIEIKRSIGEYLSKTGTLPLSLQELGIGGDVLRDRWGRQYYYERVDGSVVLGTPGEDGEWNSDEAATHSVLSSRPPCLHRERDELLVRFTP